MKSKSWKTNSKKSRLREISPQVGDTWVLSPHRPDGKKSDISVDYTITNIWFDGTIVHEAEHGVQMLDRPDGATQILDTDGTTVHG